ncbi:MULTISPECIES: DUF6498-containing protein [Haloferax]|uniref:Uncharacterized protein n=1 Tax=Haloferax massiliensis TaxID=1476858 RepID=A0A0D6JT69_9EURY|nr:MULTISPECIES: DUF6498-containing protein [Haloferax]MDS0241948.1 DUF6498-containing protein [Haloferax sp. S2CR25]MDS0445069.1 DUF6498-containing protein [Haloferax sp. S2CR25-2]CQR51121.1 hypothetical protein BN996_02575 [Haloferax massiliensis]
MSSPRSTSSPPSAASGSHPVSSPVALAALVVANLVPLVGVVWFDWSLKALLVAYWLESGVVGLLNVPKILAASGRGGGGASINATVNGRRVDLSPPESPRDGFHLYPSNVPIAGFFAMHYGIFWVVHGVFVWSFDAFAPGAGAVGGVSGVPLGAVLLAASATLLSHGGSFAVNFVGREEYRSVSPGKQMSEPYRRVIVLHLTIILGAFLVAASGAPAAALVVMVVVKTALDAGAHLREHARAEKRADRDGGSAGERIEVGDASA